MSSLGTAKRAKVLKGDKSPATRPKRKNADVEAEKEQACLESDAHIAHLAEVEAHATELKKQ